MPAQRFNRSLPLKAALLLCTVLAGAVLTVPCNGARAAATTEEVPVNLLADKVIHDEEHQRVTATGNVEMEQSGRILRAKEIVYDLEKDKVTASGGVTLLERNGDVHFADEVTFTDEMKNGFVSGLRTLLSDGSRFTAKEGERKNGTRIEMREASYTPCEPCREHPERAPVWALKADEVVYDQTEHRVSYKDATFEVLGVPLAWTPYFSHPDGTIKRKSGFLQPKFGYDSQMGVSVGSAYYFDIAPDQDATIGARVFSGENPQLTGEWRKRFASAAVKMQGSVTSSDRTDKSANENIDKNNELRGHVFGQGQWDINREWRAGFDIEATSDDQYLRQYDLSDDDVLENDIYAERFSGRNYAVGRALLFQDLRVSADADQPNVIPEMMARFVGEPNAAMGGRWSVETSLLGLRRSGDGQDMDRASLALDWERRFVSDLGLVTTATAMAREDIYMSADLETTETNGDSTRSRFFPSFNVQSRYPLAKPIKGGRLGLEPTVALTVSPNIDAEKADIPNEDSQDAQLDASNLFKPNRFPGVDRLEDNSHLTYGLRAGVYEDGGNMYEVFFGQSYQLQDAENPFPRGSGLTEQASDFVGEISMLSSGNLSLNYRFQLGGDNLQFERQELDASAWMGDVTLYGRYLFARPIEGASFDEPRENAFAGAAYRFADDWQARGEARVDLGDNPGLRTALLGLDYFGQCFSVSTTAERNLTDDATGKSDTTIMTRIGLKNLGELVAVDFDVPESTQSSSQ